MTTHTTFDREINAPGVAEEDRVSLCLLLMGVGHYGIDTRRIREVLAGRMVQRVPLAPAYIGGMVPYRGEVLTAVSFRALLGLAPSPGESVVLVLDVDDEQDEKQACEGFGLMVDAVGGVVTVSRRLLAPNPTTLDERGKALFDGAYPMPDGLLVQVDSRLLRPTRLGETGLFSQQRGPMPYENPSQSPTGNRKIQEATCAR